MRNAQRAEQKKFFEAIASAVSHRLLSNLVGAAVMLNLLIAIMGDTYERVCSTDEFVECIDILLENNKMTHEINHELVKKLVPINYIAEYNDDLELGHEVFTICR